jgi:hypothetical protein
MPMTTRRLRGIATLALLLALLAGALPAPAVARQSATGVDVLAAARAATLSADPVLVGEDYALEQDDGYITKEDLADDVRDFLATYTIVVPRDGVAEPYDHGLEFRSSDDGFFQFAMLSSDDTGGLPTWAIFLQVGGSVDVLTEAKLRAGQYDDEPGAKNIVEVAVIGDLAVVAINGAIIGEADLRGENERGAVRLTTGITSYGTLQGSIVEFEDVSLWAFDDGDVAGGSVAPTGDEVWRSELYDASLTYGAPWAIYDSEIDEDEEREVVALTNGTSWVDMILAASEETTADCVDLEITWLATESTTHDEIEVATNRDGETMLGAAADGSYHWGVVRAVETYDAGPTDVIIYIRCQALVPGEALLLITHSVPAGDYNAEIPARRALLAGLGIGDDAVAGPIATATPAVTATTAGGGEERPSTRDEPTPTPAPTRTPATAAAGSVIVEIGPVAGRATGRATLSADGSRTAVEVSVRRAPEGALVVLQAGSCDDLAGEPAYRAGELDAAGTSRARVRASLDELEGAFAVTLVDPDTLDYAEPLACGDIPG